VKALEKKKIGQKKTTQLNKPKQPKLPASVASYDTRPGNKVRVSTAGTTEDQYK